LGFIDLRGEIGVDSAQRDPSGGENRCKVQEPSGVLPLAHAARLV